MAFKLYNFIFYITMAAFGYFNIYFQDAGLDSFQIGLVNAIPRIFALLLMPFWGFLTDYFHENKKVLLITLIGTLATVVLFPQTSSFKVLMLLMFFYTLFQNPIIPLSDSLLLDYLGDNSNYYGKFRLWGSVGYMLSVSLLGYFLEATSSANLFYIYGIILILSIFLLKFLPKSKRKIKVLDPGDFKKIFKKRRLLYFLFFVFILQTSMNANYSYFPLYIVAHGGGEFLVGIALTVSSASEILAFFFSDKIIKNNKFSKIIVVISLGFILRWLMLSLFPYNPIILFSQLLHSITFGLFFAVGVDYVDQISGEKFRATGQNIYAGVFMGVSAISGSLIGGKIYQLYGGENMYFFWSLISAAAGIIYSFYLLKKERELKINAD
ncbi:PPP family 3-phenylpropionic acid transporter [Halanaerobium saccharolyticum]|uniref:PPP family 3-phenylpropionic acid transporter n=1 Tax=Halanaerobium saccharolyticum TaxID=43595 RepID=A0A4R6LNI6_9FIRM|nr:MFS transporter [Halanaerobium saccharolyticum]TDO87862.1 PPP family 3-phenylpropionic acid transporter [Halanaerobium saccharolyticum]